jgi:hypothetical protein
LIFKEREKKHSLGARLVTRQSTALGVRRASFYQTKPGKKKKKAPTGAGGFVLVVIVMDHGLLAIAVLIFLFDDGLAVGGFVLLHESSIMVTRLADRHACSDRTGMNSDVVSKSWRGEADRNRSSNQIFLHVSLLNR